MKLKKKYIIFVIFILLIIPVLSVLKKNNIIIDEIQNKNYKESFTFESDAICSSRLTNYKTESNGLVGKSTNSLEINNGYGEYFHIITNGTENLFLVDGCKWSIDAFLIEYEKMIGLTEVKNICNQLKTQSETDNEILTRYNNSICVQNKTNINYREENVSHSGYGFDKIKLSTITLDFQGGWGPTTLGENWSGSDGVYYVQGIIGNSHTFQFDDNLINYNYNLIGWSKSSDCSTKMGTGGLNHTFTFENSNITYYACYSGDVFEGSLFNSDDTKKTGFGEKVYENASCDDAEITSSNIKQVPMKTMSKYVKQSNETIKPDLILGKENTYCNVMCTDTVDVYYPNIFETVPAGQYFELMYEPEIKASRTCQSEFRYIDWKTAYNTALNNEITKLDALSEAQAYYEAAQALEYDTTCENCCGCCCSGPECTCSGGCYDSYSDKQKAYFYKTNSSNATSTSASASGCGSSEMSSSISSEQLSAKNALKQAEEEYEEAVKERIRLEQFNLQCYTILDSDKSNDIDITYNDTLDITNYNIIDDTFTYKIDTPKINLSSDRYGTKDNYLNYIIKDSMYYDNTKTITESQLKFLTAANEFMPNLNLKSTSDFYIINPTIKFKYNTGEQKEASKTREENLTIEGHVKKDTGSYTSATPYIKDASTENFTRKFYIEYTKSDDTCDTGDYGDCSTPSSLFYSTYKNYINFDAYQATKTYRKVEYYFTFHEATEYCSKAQSGEITTGICSGLYKSLSKNNEYTNRNGNKIYLKNHVYPVSLNAVNNKYPVLFTLKESLSTLDINNYTKFDGFTGNYTCEYEITNDALTLKNELTKNYKDLKSNTIFRSIAPDNLDPNERAKTGNLGENWLNKKGKAVQELIKVKETHDGITKDTYNEKNLEYSFTLTPTLINKIKEYNDEPDRTYDDFNLTCATEDNRECISDFLTELTADNYSSGINKWNGLNAIRTNWKYYIEDISLTTTDLKNNCEHLGNKIYNCRQGKMNLDTYNKIYETWGVLP